MKIAAVVAIALLTVGCSSGGADDPDWSGIPQNQRNLIERAARDGDCQKMQGYFDQVNDADVLDWLDQQMRNAGCY